MLKENHFFAKARKDIPRKNGLAIALRLLGISESLITHALQQVDEGKASVKQAYLQAIDNEEKAQTYYVENALSPWAQRHGLTLLQAINIVCNDSDFNPDTKKHDLPTLGGLFWVSGLHNNYFHRLQKQLEESPEITAQKATNLVYREYRESAGEDVMSVMLKAMHALPASPLSQVISEGIDEISRLRQQIWKLKQGAKNVSAH